jgi:hypothetical protein
MYKDWFKYIVKFWCKLCCFLGSISQLVFLFSFWEHTVIYAMTLFLIHIIIHIVNSSHMPSNKQSPFISTLQMFWREYG